MNALRVVCVLLLSVLFAPPVTGEPQRTSEWRRVKPRFPVIRTPELNTQGGGSLYVPTDSAFMPEGGLLWIDTSGRGRMGEVLASQSARRLEREPYDTMSAAELVVVGLTTSGDLLVESRYGVVLVEESCPGMMPAENKGDEHSNRMLCVEVHSTWDPTQYTIPRHQQGHWVVNVRNVDSTLVVGHDPDTGTFTVRVADVNQ